ncbi:MAG: hypothetical protein FJ137_00650 [Deltaproteobacteria bacterium]|nr:hypothetical protein [Deltaproteobacteria bacterium]
MRPRKTAAENAPLPSVSPDAGSTLTPGGAVTVTRTDGTGAPSSSTTTTPTGWGSARPTGAHWPSPSTVTVADGGIARATARMRRTSFSPLSVRTRSPPQVKARKPGSAQRAAVAGPPSPRVVAVAATPVTPPTIDSAPKALSRRTRRAVDPVSLT